ncbi:MAG: SDR family oxidoreductase [Betaproteobacteria bacterium]|nr:MAG: SDR family oxidoreductase [Betaproteobacteria bacterium]
MTTDALFSLDQRVAVITGGASGLGFAMSEAMASYGARVVLLDCNAEKLASTRAKLRAAGLEVETHVVDVSRSDDLRRAFEDVVQRHGRLDILAANAGISGGPSSASRSGSIEIVPRALWDRVLAVNLTGAFESLQCAARHMKAQKSGRIIVTCSAAGLHAEPLVGYAYAASKAALAQIVRQAAVELAPHGILINAIAPGPFATGIADGAFTDPRVQAVLAQCSLLGRIGQPEEIKGLTVLLASDASSFITGAVIPLDGGSLA